MPPPTRPPPYRLDEAALAADTLVDIYTGGGPGGQHRNKTRNAVRLLHVPSGVVVTATERRSLEANRQAAFARLVARLEALNHVPTPRTATKPSRSSKRRRLAGKQHQGEKKRFRRRPVDD